MNLVCGNWLRNIHRIFKLPIGFFVVKYLFTQVLLHTGTHWSTLGVNNFDCLFEFIRCAPCISCKDDQNISRWSTCNLGAFYCGLVLFSKHSNQCWIWDQTTQFNRSRTIINRNSQQLPILATRMRFSLFVTHDKVASFHAITFPHLHKGCITQELNFLPVRVRFRVQVGGLGLENFLLVLISGHKGSGWLQICFDTRILHSFEYCFFQT